MQEGPASRVDQGEPRRGIVPAAQVAGRLDDEHLQRGLHPTGRQTTPSGRPVGTPEDRAPIAAEADESPAVRRFRARPTGSLAETDLPRGRTRDVRPARSHPVRGP